MWIVQISFHTWVWMLQHICPQCWQQVWTHFRGVFYHWKCQFDPKYQYLILNTVHLGCLHDNLHICNSSSIISKDISLSSTLPSSLFNNQSLVSVSSCLQSNTVNEQQKHTELIGFQHEAASSCLRLCVCACCGRGRGVVVGDDYVSLYIYIFSMLSAVYSVRTWTSCFISCWDVEGGDTLSDANVCWRSIM